MPEPTTEPTVAAPCGGCGCVCDDTLLALVPGAAPAPRRTCALGTAWFEHRVTDRGADAIVDGEVVEREAALEAAAELLARAQAPLLYGFGRTSTEAVAEAVALADRLGAAIDTAGAVLDGGAGRAVALRGASIASLGEIRDRVGPIVLWREDPKFTHPRLLERLALPSPERPLIAVSGPDGPHPAADRHVTVPADRDLEALQALRLLIADLPVDPGQTAGIDLAALGQLAELLRAGPHVVLVHGRGLGAGPGGHRRALALHELARELDRQAHTVTLQLRTEANAVGADDVLAWQTGFPSAIDLGAGHPRSLPPEGSASGLIGSGSVDLVVSVASDPATDLPSAARQALSAIPLVALDAVPTATMRQAKVAIATAAVGVGRRGTVHRMDGVPIPLGEPVATARPGEDQVLRELARRIDGRAR